MEIQIFRSISIENNLLAFSEQRCNLFLSATISNQIILSSACV